jgi:uncharacterized phage protein (TIGR01671 family)
MREIKFRAWDIDRRVMVDDLLRSSETKARKMELLGLHEYAKMLAGDFYSQFVVMQYAGLKDNNGREIYEGDVLDFTDANGTKGGKTIVEYEFKKLAALQQRMPLWDTVEVIGNIYENPELIR